MAKKDNHSHATPPRQQGFVLARPLFIVSIILGAALLGAGGMYAYNLYTQQSKTEFERVQEKVGAMMQLPTEVPTFATVSDAAKLNTQAFFSNAQNGDKVLIYPLAKKAVLYRPSTNRIIEVGPINIAPTEAQVAGVQATPTISPSASPSAKLTASPTSKPSPTKEVSIAVYNGTKKVGLTKEAQTQLQSAYPAGKVNLRKDAKGNYATTIVIPLETQHKATASVVAGALKATVGSLPEGETKPDADLLIILGEDFAER